MRPIQLWSATALLACSLVTSSSAVPRNGCDQARLRDLRVGNTITDPRVIKAIQDAARLSGLGSEVTGCYLKIPYLTATVENLGDSYYVGVTRVLTAHFNDAELRAVFGHEMAHIVLGHRAAGFELTHLRSAEYEKAADALSAKWFGKPAMRNVLRKLRTDAVNLRSPAERRLSVVELNERLRALQ